MKEKKKSIKKPEKFWVFSGRTMAYLLYYGAEASLLLVCFKEFILMEMLMLLNSSSSANRSSTRVFLTSALLHKINMSQWFSD